MNDCYFKYHHQKYRDVFTKDTFFKFYGAVKNNIMKATTFRFSKETYIQIMNLFRTHANEDAFWEVFDLAMQELYDFDLEHYITMCQYLFKEYSRLDDDSYILLEFYALLELEAKNRPFSDDVEGKLNFLLDDFYTQCDDAVIEYFNVSENTFWEFFRRYEDIEIDELYIDLISVNIQNKNFKRAFVYLIKALFLSIGIGFYKVNGEIKTFRIKQHAEV